MYCLKFVVDNKEFLRLPTKTRENIITCYLRVFKNYVYQVVINCINVQLLFQCFSFDRTVFSLDETGLYFKHIYCI